MLDWAVGLLFWSAKNISIPWPALVLIGFTAGILVASYYVGR